MKRAAAALLLGTGGWLLVGSWLVPTPRIVARQAAGPIAHWADATPDSIFDADSAANRLTRPRALAGAQLGYFTDPAITRQYAPAQLAAMRRDSAGFVAVRDLDGDGVPETYRTGYWRRADRIEGTFLVAFVRGRQAGFVDTGHLRLPGVFLSWADGRGLVVSGCRCPQGGRVTFDAGRLRVADLD